MMKFICLITFLLAILPRNGTVWQLRGGVLDLLRHCLTGLHCPRLTVSCGLVALSQAQDLRIELQITTARFLSIIWRLVTIEIVCTFKHLKTDNDDCVNEQTCCAGVLN
jgi:hypothetical protein